MTNTKFLDGIRGLAALYVLLHHARWLLWEGYTRGYKLHPDAYNLLDKTIMYSSNIFIYGHEAVLLFLVLSGFVIHLKYAKALQNNQEFKFDFLDYFLKRIHRIYPPLVVALILTLVLDYIGGGIF